MQSLDEIMADHVPGRKIVLDEGDYEIRTPCLRDRRDLTLLGRGPEQTRVHGYFGDVMNLDRCTDVFIGQMSLYYDGPPVGAATSNRGVNGVSVTNGSDRICVHRVRAHSMPGIAMTDRYDGGKAFTLQTAGLESRDVMFDECAALGCPIGVGCDALGTENVVLTVVNFTAIGCRLAVSLSARDDNKNRPPNEFGARIAGLRADGCPRLAIVSRFSNVWLQDVVATRTPAATPDPFTKYWRDYAMTQRASKNVTLRRALLEGKHSLSLEGWDVQDVISNGSEL